MSSLAFWSSSWLVLALSGEPAQELSGMEKWGSALVMIVPIILIFWLMIVRPESKRRKEHESMLNNLRVSDRVIANGIIGTVAKVEKDEVVVIVDAEKKIKMRFRREAIQFRESSDERAEADRKEENGKDEKK